MKKSFVTNKAILLVLLAAMCCAVLVASLVLPTSTANAYTGDNLPQTSYDIYHSAHKKFNASELSNLFKQLGSPDGTYAKLPAATSAGESVAAKEIIVELGGMKWIAVYYSSAVTTHGTGSKGKASSGDKILTLWLAEATTKTYQWNQNYDNDSNTGDYPSNVYGTSYIRAYVLNNGGSYWTNNGTNGSNTNAGLGGSATVSSSNVFANFTTDAIGLISNNAIVAPRYIDWQWTQDGANVKNSDGTACSTYGFNNDSLSKGCTFDGYDWSTKTGYTTWQDDYLWLPSLAETGTKTYNVGTLWAPTTNQLTSLGGIWLRSGNYSHSISANYLNRNGDRIGDHVHSSVCVRPALHLNLAAADKAAEDITHTWSATWTWNPNTSSKNDGVTPTATATVTCSVCGESYTNVAATVTRTNYTASTCTTAGSETWQAEITEYGVSTSQTYSLPTLSHNYNRLNIFSWSTDELTETSMPTATASIKCATCTNKVNATTTVTERTASKQSPTCSETGSRTFYATATYGSTSLTIPDKTYTIAAKGHSFSTQSSAATCTTAGYNRKYCSVCSKYFESSAGTYDTGGSTSSSGVGVISASGHSFTTQSIAATCTAAGYNRKYCSACSKYFESSAGTYDTGGSTSSSGVGAISAKGHSFTTQSNAATCTTAGYNRKYCSRCSKYFESTAGTYQTGGSTSSSGIGVISAKGHSWDKSHATDKAAPTCTDKGINPYWYCNTCKYYFDVNASNKAATKYGIDHYEIAATGHSLKATAWHWYNGSSEITSGSALALAAVDGVTVTVDLACTECQFTAEGVTATPAKQSESYLAPKCEETGSVTFKANIASYTCTDGCNNTNHTELASYNDEADFTINETGHLSITPVQRQAPKCTEVGYEAYFTCTDCNKNFRDGEGQQELDSLDELEIPATGHQLKVDGWNWALNADTTVNATQEITVTADISCDNCEFETKGVTAKPNAVVADSTTCDVERVITCTPSVTYNNGVEDVTLNGTSGDVRSYKLAAGQHAYEVTFNWQPADEWDKQGTPTVTVTIACSVCEDEQTSTVTVTEVEGSRTAPDCEHTGHVSFTAKATTDSEQDFTSEEQQYTIPALGHKLNKTDKVEPTYEAKGRKEYWTCSVCGKHYRDEQATQHVQDLTELDIDMLQADKTDKDTIYDMGWATVSLTAQLLVLLIAFGIAKRKKNTQRG